jgi:hypothetical protein
VIFTDEEAKAVEAYLARMEASALAYADKYRAEQGMSPDDRDPDKWPTVPITIRNGRLENVEADE